MKYKKIFKNYLIHSCIIALLIFMSQNADARNELLLKSDWRFSKGANEYAFESDFDDSGWEIVSIPHDWAISGPFDPNGNAGTAKLPWKGEGWYRNSIELPETYNDEIVYLVFDGIMSSPEIFINGEKAGKWDYGYNSFYLDITDYLIPEGNNTIAIHVDTREHESRWYPGAGIFRKITMVTVNPVHVNIWGTYITTPEIKPEYADIQINSTISNMSDKPSNIEIKYVIISPDGQEISDTSLSGWISNKSEKEFHSNIPLPNPELWEPESPELYQLKTIISCNKQIIDSCSTTFGIRNIQLTANDGLYLNGKRVHIKGVNLHHDHGPLGAAFNKRAMERQLEIMKSMGCNAIRTSHNVAAPELLELCDKMGFLVFNEAFDKYDKKSDISEETDFDDFAHRNIRNFVTRDRNHPSVFIWSVGNEMEDIQGDLNNGFQRLQIMINYVRKYDPSRPVTMASDIQKYASKRHFDFYDVHSWNYDQRWKLAKELEPNKALIISESASTLSTRGFYELPLPVKRTDFTDAMQVSSYDLNAPEWAEVLDDDFMWQEEDSTISGEFVWTGFDYLGEPTPYRENWAKKHNLPLSATSRSSYFGIVDLCGIPKDRYFLYKSHWKPEETTIHILPHWNWNEGDTIPVFVYTNGDSAELFLNGVSLGFQAKKPFSKISIERYRLMWNSVNYEPGTLKAVAFKNGKVIGENSVRTAAAPAYIKLSPDRSILKCGVDDLSYILVEAYDENGNLCPLSDNLIHFDVTGPGYIAGTGNGNPQSYEAFKAKHRKLFYGKAMLIIGTESEEGSIEIIATSPGLRKDNVSLKTEL